MRSPGLKHPGQIEFPRIGVDQRVKNGRIENELGRGGVVGEVGRHVDAELENAPGKIARMHKNTPEPNQRRLRRRNHIHPAVWPVFLKIPF